MIYYSSLCDKSVKLKFKNKPFKSLTHKKHEINIQIKHTIQNPNFLM